MPPMSFLKVRIGYMIGFGDLMMDFVVDYGKCMLYIMDLYIICIDL